MVHPRYKSEFKIRLTRKRKIIEKNLVGETKGSDLVAIL